MVFIKTWKITEKVIPYLDMTFSRVVMIGQIDLANCRG